MLLGAVRAQRNDSDRTLIADGAVVEKIRGQSSNLILTRNQFAAGPLPRTHTASIPFPFLAMKLKSLDPRRVRTELFLRSKRVRPTVSKLQARSHR